MKKIFVIITASVSFAFPANFSLLGGSEADTESQTYSYLGVIGQRNWGKVKP